jgi:hypothetical protein
MEGIPQLTEQEEQEVVATLARIRATLPPPELLPTDEPPHFFTPEALNVDFD